MRIVVVDEVEEKSLHEDKSEGHQEFLSMLSQGLLKKEGDLKKIKLDCSSLSH